MYIYIHMYIIVIVSAGLYISPNCTDNRFFANCYLIVKGSYCNHPYYKKFCCESCTRAGLLPAGNDGQPSSPYITNTIRRLRRDLVNKLQSLNLFWANVGRAYNVCHAVHVLVTKKKKMIWKYKYIFIYLYAYVPINIYIFFKQFFFQNRNNIPFATPAIEYTLVRVAYYYFFYNYYRL